MLSKVIVATKYLKVKEKGRNKALVRHSCRPCFVQTRLPIWVMRLAAAQQASRLVQLESPNVVVDATSPPALRLTARCSRFCDIVAHGLFWQSEQAENEHRRRRSTVKYTLHRIAFDSTTTRRTVTSDAGRRRLAFARSSK